MVDRSPAPRTISACWRAMPRSCQRSATARLSVYRTEKGEPETIAIEGGFAEVSERQALTILAERTA